MIAPYLKMIFSIHGLSEENKGAVINIFKIFIESSAPLIVFALRIYLSISSVIIFSFGCKRSMKFLSRFFLSRPFHDLILTVTLMAYFDADNSRS